MSNTQKDGGPAFPFSGVPTDGTDIPWLMAPFQGMTLRDYFAAMAMQSMISDSDVGFPYLLTAENAYLQADMMLCVRDRQ